LIVGIFVGFVGGFSALMPGFLFPNPVDTFAYSIASYPKLFWFGCMIPFILLAAYEKNILQVFTLALIVGLSFINVLPTVVAGTGLWIVGYLFFQKPGWRPLIKLVLIGVPVGLFVLLLYQLGKNPEGVTIYKNSYKAADIRTSINIFIGSVLQLLTYSPAFIILLLLFIKKEFRARFSGQISAIWMSVALIVSGMVCWAVLNRTTAESVQFFHNMFTVVCGLLSFFVYSLLIFYGRKSYLIGTGIILLLLALYPNRKFDFQIRQIPIDEQQQLTDFVKQVDQPVFAHYNLPSEYTKNYFASNTVVAVPFINLAMEIPRYANYSLNIPFVLLDTNSFQYPFIKTQVEWAPISYYIRKNGFEAMDPDSVMLQFMKEYKIPFLCVPARVSIPENLATLFVDSLYAPSIGWTVYRCSTN